VIRKNPFQPGIVIHNCNPSFLGARDWEDLSLRPAQSKKTIETPISTKRWAWWYMPVIPARQEA
jgi:hypothetical protein